MFPVAKWLLNTAYARRLRTNFNLTKVSKNDQGKWIYKTPASAWTKPAEATNDECCFHPFDFAKLNHAVRHCSHYKTTIKPLSTKQWFVKMKPLTPAALRAVADGSTRFIPERFTKIYNHWLETIHDWCISRQLLRC